MKKWHWAVLITFLVIGGGGVVYTNTRGLRNKNPGNIRWSLKNNWKGQIGKDQGDFVIFDSYANGVRAIGKIIDSYKMRGQLTVEQIITTWAPASENNTAAYVSSVVKQSGLRADTIPWREEGDYVSIVAAIIKHENGIQPFKRADIATWLAMP